MKGKVRSMLSIGRSFLLHEGMLLRQVREFRPEVLLTLL